MLDELDIDDESNEDLADDEEGQASKTRSLRRLVTQIGAGLLFLGALYGLFWNEGHGHRVSASLLEAAGQVHPADSDRIDPALNGRLIHLTARLTSERGVQDDAFALRSTGVGLYRHIEMYQWIEYEYEQGRGRNRTTQREYEMDWDDVYHDSSRFHEPDQHRNPTPALSSAVLFAEDARFGPYRFNHPSIFDDALTSLFFEQTSGKPSANGLAAWLSPMDVLPPLPEALRRQRWYQISDETYYRGNEHSEYEELGDLTANFVEMRNDFTMSIVAIQDGDTFRPWRDGNGRDLLLAVAGTRSADAMLRAEAARVASRTGLLRMIGLAAAVLGAAGIAVWLTRFLLAVPVVGPCVQHAAAAVAAVVGLLAGLLAMAAGWLVAHPLVGVLFCLAMAALIVSGYRVRSTSFQRPKAGQAGHVVTAASPSHPATANSAVPPSLAEIANIRTSPNGQAPVATQRDSTAPGHRASTSPVRAEVDVRTEQPTRVAVEQHGRYVIHRVVRRHSDGREELLHHELSGDGARPIKRATLDEVRRIVQMRSRS